MMSDGRGAQWSIWDLHAHTPLSLHQGYGGDKSEVWARYFQELRSLPPDIKVLGINDYWFVDGYRKVRKEFDAGNLPNLDEVFPVVEMRLSNLAGTDGHLKKINLHVIFDPDLSVDTIEQQFVNGLRGKFDLGPGTSLKWAGALTRDSLIDLGNQVREATPAAQRKTLSNPLALGFSNLVVSLEAVEKLLEGSYLKGRTVLAAGKAEWAEIKWSGQSAAIKKTLANTPRLLFTAFKDTSTWAAQRATLKAQLVNDNLVDCSDAHYFSDSKESERLGNCWTWMRTTPTFAGLVHAIDEFEHRVFVGLEPASLGRLRIRPSEYLDNVRIGSEKSHTPQLFDYEVPLNDGFVAIVGNKGQGKSALLDCIALAGNSSRTSEFAFLNTRRFLSPSNREAKDYVATVRWANGVSNAVALDRPHDRGAAVAVEYLPQSYVERVCTTPPDSDESAEFENELKEVLFTHIAEEDKERETTFDGLLARRTTASVDAVAKLRNELEKICRRVEEAAAFQASNRPADVTKLIAAKQKDVEAAKADLAVQQSALAQADAESTENSELSDLRLQATAIEAKIVASRAAVTQTRLEIAGVSEKLARVDDLLRRLRAIGVEVDDINVELIGLLDRALEEPLVALTQQDEELLIWRAGASELQSALRARLAVEESAASSLVVELEEISDALAASDGVRELARQRVNQAQARVDGLIGDERTEGTLTALLKLLADAEEAPRVYLEAVESLLGCASSIYTGLAAELDGVASLYRPASEFIEGSDVVRSAGLRFRAELVISGRIRNIGSAIDNRRSPDLGRWIGDLSERVDPMDWDSIRLELSTAMQRLTSEKGDSNAGFRDPVLTMRTATTLGEFLSDLFGLTWLDVRFGLTGDGLPLSQLSPGQRGLVLALFYLVVDRRTTPLLLDQPEENLDNATIASRLVPAIREAAGRRQTIIVTHNANLAIVGDADQIIHCTVEDKVFGATSGAISELAIAQSAVDILEGTKPAFDNRRHRYEVFRVLGENVVPPA